MTPGTPDKHEELFVADFYPELGEYLAEQHATGYDSAAERTSFLLWLARHVAGRPQLLDDHHNHHNHHDRGKPPPVNG
jgi:hypothetical protein